MPPGPLVVTLTLDRATHAFLTELRRQYFPPTRNFLAAHVTLFHAIPPHREDELRGQLRDLCQRTARWKVGIAGPKRMGQRGVMLSVRHPHGILEQLHERLLADLRHGVHTERDRLTEQDDRPLRASHVTVLNKEDDPEKVDKCFHEVQNLLHEEAKEYQSRTRGEAIGLDLWEYAGGPWNHRGFFEFKGVDGHHPGMQRDRPH